MKIAIAFVAAGSVLSGGLAAAQPAPAPDPPASAAQIRELLELTGAVEGARLMVESMIDSFKPQAPGLPAEFWTEMKAGLNPEELIDQLVPVYQKHFSSADMEALAVFWRSPVGRKFAALQPEIMMESMELGRVWGEKKGREIAARIQQRAPKRN